MSQSTSSDCIVNSTCFPAPLVPYHWYGQARGRSTPRQAAHTTCWCWGCTISGTGCPGVSWLAAAHTLAFPLRSRLDSVRNHSCSGSTPKRSRGSEPLLPFFWSKWVCSACLELLWAQDRCGRQLRRLMRQATKDQMAECPARTQPAALLAAGGWFRQFKCHQCLSGVLPQHKQPVLSTTRTGDTLTPPWHKFSILSWSPGISHPPNTKHARTHSLLQGPTPVEYQDFRRWGNSQNTFVCIHLDTRWDAQEESAFTCTNTPGT